MSPSPPFPSTPNDPVAPLPPPAPTGILPANAYVSEFGWGGIFAGIVVFVLVSWIVDTLLLWQMRGIAPVSIRLVGAGVMCGLSAAALLFLARLRSAVAGVLPTLQFAVAMLTVIGVATVAGTFILQGEVKESYEAKYGLWAAWTVQAAGLDDLFHSLWFGGLLNLLAFSLGITIYKHRAWRLPTLGLFLSHFGVITIVFGGMVGYVSGFKARIDLHEGMSAQTARVTKHGRDTNQQHGLGFQLRLDRFEIDRFPVKYRLYLHKIVGESYTTEKSLEATATEAWTKVDANTAIRVQTVYPDFTYETKLEAAADGAPGAEIVLRKQADQVTRALGAGGPDSTRLTENGPLLKFMAAAPTAAELAAWKTAKPARHRLSRRTLAPATPESQEVMPGNNYTFASDALQVRVLQYLPDFTYNIESKQPMSRSQQPNNPALQIQLMKAGQPADEPMWLFAKMPDFSMGKSGQAVTDLQLRYSFEPAQRGEPRVLAIVADTQELLECSDGEIVRRQPLKTPLPLVDGIELAEARLLPGAKITTHPITRSQEMHNPVLAVEVRTPTGTLVELLPCNNRQPYYLSDEKHLLMFQSDGGAVKAYRSHVTVIDGGREMLKDYIEVNRPLSYGGYDFYQANYRPEDPTYSGFQVVHDPGLMLIWLGLLMISFGVIYNYYVRPRLVGRIPV